MITTCVTLTVEERDSVSSATVMSSRMLVLLVVMLLLIRVNSANIWPHFPVSYTVPHLPRANKFSAVTEEKKNCAFTGGGVCWAPPLCTPALSTWEYVAFSLTTARLPPTQVARRSLPDAANLSKSEKPVFARASVS